MNEMIQWLERQADWYELVAKHAWRDAVDEFGEDDIAYTLGKTRYAAYTSVSQDLRIKARLEKALHPCPTTP